MDYLPLTKDRWPDLEKLFGRQGAYGGCWCMWWRITRSHFETNKGDGNRAALRNIVDSGAVPGILLYKYGEPVAWCSVAPRHQYSALERSRVLKPLDEAPVWSIVCFYVVRHHRGRGLLEVLIRAAVDYARQQGANVVEAYPTLPAIDVSRMPPVSSFMGLPAVFERLGLVECARPSKSKVVMRYYVADAPSGGSR